MSRFLIKEVRDKILEYISSVDIDSRFVKYDILGSIAHVEMLSRRRIIDKKIKDKIVYGLRTILKNYEDGNFNLKSEFEDVHMNIEHELKNLIGDLADYLHTGRSRNDQVALDIKLFLKNETKEILKRILKLQKVILKKSEDMLGVVFPGYSHLQQAQPVLFSHVLLSFFEMLQRDFERFISSSKRNNYSPLGAGAIAGSSLPLSPDLVAKKLGFNGSFKNSIDAVSDRDFLLDFVFSASVLMIHLSQISENLILWSTSEFGFIYLPDELITGSSLMPQKRNPDVLELIRARSGRVAGELVNLLFILKALPLGYNRDLQETKRCAVISSDAVRSSLEMMGIIFERIDIDTDRVSQVISEFIFATDIVEFLVKRDVPFRKAYNIVVKLIEYCVRKKLNLSELDANTLGKFHPELRDINLLDPHLSANSKITPGGTSIKNVEKQIKSGWRIIRRNESLCG